MITCTLLWFQVAPKLPRCFTVVHKEPPSPPPPRHLAFAYPWNQTHKITPIPNLQRQSEQIMANIRRSVLFGISRFLNSTAAPARVLGGASSNATIPYQTLYRFTVLWLCVCVCCLILFFYWWFSVSFRPYVNSFSRFYSSNGGVESLDFDLSNEESRRILTNRFAFSYPYLNSRSVIDDDYDFWFLL